MQILQNPIVAVAVTLALVLSGNWLREQWRKAQAERAAREAVRNAVFDNLAEAIKTLHDAMERQSEDSKTTLKTWQEQLTIADRHLIDAKASNDAFLAGTMKACEAIAVTTDKHRIEIKEFRRLCFGNDPGKEALQVPTDADKDRIYSLVQHRMAGHTEEEAEALADLDAEKAASAAYPTE